MTKRDVVWVIITIVLLITINQSVRDGNAAGGVIILVGTVIGLVMYITKPRHKGN